MAANRWLQVLLLLSLVAITSATADEPNSSLRAEILRQDAAMFDAFNNCEGEQFGSYLAGDVEFYHDNDGVIRAPETLIEAVNTSICGNFTRQAIPHTMEVWPIPGFGALQTGWHSFINHGADSPHGMARFLHVWRHNGDGQWVVTRIVSYDHRAYDPTAIPEIE